MCRPTHDDRYQPSFFRKCPDLLYHEETKQLVIGNVSWLRWRIIFHVCVRTFSTEQLIHCVDLDLLISRIFNMGCMSSKQAKSPDKQKKTKNGMAKKADRGSEDNIQNGGKSRDSAQVKETPTASQPDEKEAPKVTCPSDVDVTVDASASSDRRRTTSQHQPFLARPSTIVREDSLISEIESALNKSGDGTTNLESGSKEKTEDTTESPNAALLTTVNECSGPESLPNTAATTDVTTITDSSRSQAPENHSDTDDDAPELPPRPRESKPFSSDSDDRPEVLDDAPPVVPPRPVSSNKPSSPDRDSESGDAPPTLPPRSSQSSPPRRSSTSPSQAPPKPRRFSTDSATEEGAVVRISKPMSFRKPPPLPDDWAIIELPRTDAELRKLTPEPEQLAGIASKYVVKHISLHTDVRATTELNEKIYSAFLEVAKQHRHILQHFLTDLIEEQANCSGGEGQPTEPSHGAVIVLNREILRQFGEQEKVVLVSLETLRAVSGVNKATHALVECEVTRGLLATMAAHKSSVVIQGHCLDVLAKVALFQPSVSNKAPLDQAAVDLVCVALESFPKSVTITQSACHTLNNLVTSLYTAVNNAITYGDVTSEDLDKFITELMSLMDYVFTKCLPIVRSGLKYHDQDMAVKNDGRQFLFIYAKLETLKQRRKEKLSSSSPTEYPPPLPSKPAKPAAQQASTEPTPSDKESREPDIIGTDSPFTHKMDYENWDLLRGVLKKKSSLKGHNYSRADLQFMKQLTKTQVVALVCARAVDSHVQEALQLLDQPVSDMVATREVPPGVADFVAYQYTAHQTLIDLDPGLFVTLIDAVRYPSLSFQMAQKCVREVAGAMNGDQQVAVVAVTVEFLAATILNRALAPAMTVPKFVEEVCQELERAKAVSQNGAALVSLLSEIRQCARKNNHS